MRIRMTVVAAAAAALLLVPSSSLLAQGGRGQGRGRGAMTGRVKSVDTGAKSFVVTMRGRQQSMDITVKTDDKTEFMHGAGAGSFSDVQEGRFAVVMAQGQPGADAAAARVLVFDTQPATANGAIKSVNASDKTFVITAGGRQGAPTREVSIKTTDKTRYMVGRGAGKWDDLAADKRVMVIGEGNANTGITAVIVTVLPAGAGGGAGQ